MDETAWIERLRSQEMPVEEAVNLFAANRHWMTRVLRGCAEDDFARAGHHSERGRMTLAELVTTYVNHLDHHLRFLYAKRANLGRLPPAAVQLSRPSDGGLEPGARPRDTPLRGNALGSSADLRAVRQARVRVHLPAAGRRAQAAPSRDPDRSARRREAAQGQGRHGDRFARPRGERPGGPGGQAQVGLRHRRDAQGRPDRAPGRPRSRPWTRRSRAWATRPSASDRSTRIERTPSDDDLTRDAGDARGAGDPGDRLSLLQRVPGGPGRRARRLARSRRPTGSTTARTSTRPTGGCSSAITSPRSRGRGR